MDRGKSPTCAKVVYLIICLTCELASLLGSLTSLRPGGLLRVHYPTLAGSGYKTIKVAADSTVAEVPIAARAVPSSGSNFIFKGGRSPWDGGSSGGVYP